MGLQALQDRDSNCWENESNDDWVTVTFAGSQALLHDRNTSRLPGSADELDLRLHRQNLRWPRPRKRFHAFEVRLLPIREVIY